MQNIVYGGYCIVEDGTRNIGFIDGQEIMSHDCDFEMPNKENLNMFSTVLVKIKALEEVGGFNEELDYREDHELWLRLAYNDYKFKAIDKILTNLRIYSGNLEIKFKENDEYWYKKMCDVYKQKK